MTPGAVSKFLIIGGVTLILFGILLPFAGKVPFVGKLPGDIFIKKDNFSFYFPLTTCVLISLLLTFFSNLFGQK